MKRSAIKGKWTTLLLFCQIFSMIYFLPSAASTPDQRFCSFHSSEGYEIHTTNTTMLKVDARDLFNLEIIASGQGVIVQIDPESFNNDKFAVIPSRRITDNSFFDENPMPNEVGINVTLRAPKEEGHYKILIFARSPDFIDGMPKVVCLTFEVIVGTLTISDLLGWIFTHVNIYLGLSIIGLLFAATITYEKNVFSTKVHGILATASLVLAIISIALSFDFLLFFFTNILWHYPETYWYLFHIIAGLLGLIAGMSAFLLGLAGIRTKKPGYVALISWSLAFLSGILYWGVYLR